MATPDLKLAEAWLNEAVDTLRRLPAAVIRARLSHWPDMVRSGEEAYGYARIRPRPAPAAPAAIDRLDRTLDALRALDLDDQRLLWSRANGASWRRIAGFVGLAPNTCRSHWLVALGRYAVALNLAGR